MNSCPQLAERMRPKSLNDYLGQKHLAKRKGPMRKAMENGSLPSMFFWGPPEWAKLRWLISYQNYPTGFYLTLCCELNEQDVREVIERAARQTGRRESAPILFIDQIHRFFKPQRDILLM